MNATVKEGQGYRLDAVFNSVHHKINIAQWRQWNFQNQKYFTSFSAFPSVTPVQHISFYLQVIKNLISWVYCSRALHCSHHYPSASYVHAQAHLQTPLLLPWMLSFGTTSFSISSSFNNSGLCCASHRYFLCASHCYCPFMHEVLSLPWLSLYNHELLFLQGPFHCAKIWL